MDPASLTLAILPLMVEALKAYRLAHGKLLIFCHYSREVKRLQKRIKQQRQIFKSECELLLRATSQDATNVSDMVDDMNHARWEDELLGQRLRSTLKDNYECCIETIEEIKGVLEELQVELKAFEDLGKYSYKDEPLKDTVRRLRGAVKITFKKTEYERCIDDLRGHNAALCQLRGYAHSLESLALQNKQSSTGRGHPNIAGIRNASQKLYDALLQDVDNVPANTASALKLCIEAQNLENAICLDLILCKAQADDSEPKQMEISMTPFRQITVETIDLQIEDQGDTDSAWVLTKPIATESRKRACPMTSAGKSCGKRRVRFLGAPTGPRGQNIVQCKPPSLMMPITSSNQQCHPSIFSDLLRKACKTQIKTSRCPGLSETSKSGYKHVFHSSADCTMRKCCQSIMPQANTVISLSHALETPVDDTVSMLDQYRLARSLVLGVLQYHGTGWLADEWSSGDVAVFSRNGEFSGLSLRTLHYTKRLPFATPLFNGDEMDGIEGNKLAGIPGDAFAVDRLRCEGILNLVMYCLGLQLIRIASWSLLPNISPVEARKLVEPRRRPPLGDRFRELSRKCLECDFGFGKDLTNIALQKAIYKDVVLELDNLIESVAALDLQDD